MAFFLLFFRKTLRYLPSYFAEFLGLVLLMGIFQLPGGILRLFFIPKVGEDNYFEAKSFRPISLTSFLLKTIEKLVDRFIRKITLRLLRSL